MSGHAYHEGDPGYSPDQILHDGCNECAMRSAVPATALARMDTDTFARAWYRAKLWETGDLGDVAQAEVALLSALWAVRVQLERAGMLVVPEVLRFAYQAVAEAKS